MESPLFVFDLGGVLLPFERGRRIGAMVEALRIEAERAEVFLSSGIAERLDLGQAGLPELASGMSELAGREVSESEAKRLSLSVFETPNMPLWNAVAALRLGVRTAALSDNPTYVADIFPRADAFDFVFWSADLKITKPDSRVFEAVGARTLTPPSDIVFIDDSLTNVRAARASGWDGILFRSNSQLTLDLSVRGFPIGRL